MSITDRHLFIGSSDAADIIAGNYDKLYDLKMGIREPDDLSDVFSVQLGILTEEFHIGWTVRRLNEQTGNAYTVSMGDDSQHWSTFEPELAFNTPVLRSHPDALLSDAHGDYWPVEVKITGRFSSVDEAAEFYMPQLQHHLICWGSNELLFSVVRGTSEPERVWIGASREYQDFYLEKCDTFWGYIKEQIPPPRNMSVGNGDARKIVPQKVQDSVPFDRMTRRSIANDNRAPGLIDEFIETQKFVKRHEAVKEELKSMMRDDEREIYTDTFSIKRDRRGAKRITIKEAING